MDGWMDGWVILGATGNHHAKNIVYPEKSYVCMHKFEYLYPTQLNPSLLFLCFFSVYRIKMEVDGLCYTHVPYA